MNNFQIIFILLLSPTIILCVPPSPPPPQTPEASCTIENQLKNAISSNPSTPQHIILEFPSRLEKVLAKPEVLNAAGRTEKASALRKLLKYYSDKDHQIHLDKISRFKLPSSKVKSFWINNAISVTAVPPKIINSLVSIKSWKPCVIRMAMETSILGNPTAPSALSGTSRTNRPTPAAPTPSTPVSSTTTFNVHPAAWGVRKMDAPTNWWSKGYRGQGIVVAIIDTGVNSDHESLRHNYGGHWEDYVDPVPPSDTSTPRPINPQQTRVQINPPRPFDPHGHGTMVASVIVGRHVGMAPAAKWVACRALPPIGREGNEDGTTQCAQWITGLNPLPDIVCNSWGYLFPGSPHFNGHIETWDSMGIHHVFAIGNDGPNCGTVRSPGDQSIAFSVGSVDFHDKPDPTSSRGPNPIQLNLKPDISAPGKDILVADAFGTYTTASGTSFAAPHVAGAMALLLSANHAVPPGEFPVNFIRRTLIEHSDKKMSAYLTIDDRSCFFTGSMYPNAAIGHGILNISTIPSDWNLPTAI